VPARLGPHFFARSPAILDPSRAPLGAVHVAASLSEWTAEDFEQRMAPLVTNAAGAISD
jgi:IclR family transcriptional regulator, pca regulon regulatory protein